MVIRSISGGSLSDYLATLSTNNEGDDFIVLLIHNLVKDHLSKFKFDLSLLIRKRFKESVDL